MTRTEIENLGTERMNTRCAAIIGRYWEQQGYAVEVYSDWGPLQSDLLNGLPRGYRGEDATTITRALAAAGGLRTG